MERLTVKSDDGTCAINKRYTAGNVQEVVDRLAAYEDTGLEPDMIEATINGQITLQKALEKYTQAEEQGRLVVLPCKVGDTVYRTHRIFGKTSISEERFSPSDAEWVGKTVFLTREEAERALEGGVDNA